MESAVSVISTDSVPVSHRLPYWRDLVCDVFVELSCETAKQRGFYGQIEDRQFVDLQCSHVKSTAHHVRRDTTRIARSSADHFLVSLQVKGLARLLQDGREALLQPGDFALYDVTRPYELIFNDEFEQLVLQVPREQIGTRLFDIDNLTAVGVSGKAGTGRLASMLIAQTVDQLPYLDEASLRQVQASTLDLMASALANQTDQRSEIVSEGQELTIRRILQYIEDRLGDPSLTCEKVALENGISERYLRKLFQSKGHGVAEWIWQRRLEKAKQDLQDPLMGHRSVTSIAYDWGFKDTAHFSRAFKKRFDHTPRAARKLSISGEQNCLRSN
ncbi:MAG: helix-turn-helix domain-containing protein [Pseudomonadota bacterium]